ncbi:MAG: hypothetical protein JOY71_18925 [Acetobacteraceae bacterium]|nr:hypothetical protein [Acetobacteraceae bacterium]MBV8524167.1 hypothetical protein [Acetobacteraceae bacterium]
MAFISAYLALCSAVGTGTATEVSTTGYSRQPISFAVPRNGVCTNARPWNFGFPKPGPLAGRAIYDQPAGGNLLLVMPFFTARPTPGGGPVDAGDVGDIVINLTALQGFAEGEAFSGSLAAGAVVGTVYDRQDIVGPVVSGGGYQLVTNSSQLSTGVALAVNRGILAAHGVFVS